MQEFYANWTEENQKENYHTNFGFCLFEMARLSVNHLHTSIKRLLRIEFISLFEIINVMVFVSIFSLLLFKLTRHSKIKNQFKRPEIMWTDWRCLLLLFVTQFTCFTRSFLFSRTLCPFFSRFSFFFSVSLYLSFNLPFSHSHTGTISLSLTAHKIRPRSINSQSMIADVSHKTYWIKHQIASNWTSIHIQHTIKPIFFFNSSL